MMQFSKRLYPFIFHIWTILFNICNCTDNNSRQKDIIDPRILELSTQVEKMHRKYNLIYSIIVSGTLLLILASTMGFILHDHIMDVKMRRKRR
ncbi:conserved Plasmodium protein, unknown function [Plasmodium ovale]|uniref:Uncharacterized protein n=1 Tax=Plasmodium ovale TaxID=36330 RepID=A0A1D3U7A8_PLAOA|nr:conserved Plasmodium protein, unknown function [Plasmodium ovale]